MEAYIAVNRTVRALNPQLPQRTLTLSFSLEGWAESHGIELDWLDILPDLGVDFVLMGSKGIRSTGVHPTDVGEWTKRKSSASGLTGSATFVRHSSCHARSPYL